QEARGETRAKAERIMMRRIGLAALSYLVPTFVLGFVWHLILFKNQYDALEIYRRDVIIPFGLLSMLIQAVFFAWVFDRSFGNSGASPVKRGLVFAGFGAALSWSFTTIAVAAKNVMTSVPDYLLIETAFTLAQWAIVGPLMALAHAKAAKRTHSFA
ncbi:MAG TPA: hypothetical protein VFU02_21955, partial [Polyangiaceae bacterium]|nr:hypothetical protein [Polyangiaceae bacterium]